MMAGNKHTEYMVYRNSNHLNSTIECMADSSYCMDLRLSQIWIGLSGVFLFFLPYLQCGHFNEGLLQNEGFRLSTSPHFIHLLIEKKNTKQIKKILTVSSSSTCPFIQKCTN